MSDDLIPVDVRNFILRHIDSIAQLEALLLLVHTPDEQWTADKVADRLYIGAEEAKDVLARLCSDGLISDTAGTHRFIGEPAAQRDVVERLSALYSRHLVPVTNLVHSKPAGIRAFAAAFKLRKDK